MRNLLTGYECLALFTDEVQKKIKVAIVNDSSNKGVENAWDVAMEHKYANGADFLASSFIWGETSEGHFYWSKMEEIVMNL